MSLPLFQTVGPAGFGVYAFDSDSWELIPADGNAEDILAPGFVDIHIHGSFGIDFMSASMPDVVRWADELAMFGYEYFYPTTVSASLEDVLRALAVLPEHPMIPGFHLEGPFLSPKFPGAQPPEAIAPIPAADSPWWEVLNDPRLRVITLAPELDGAHDLIARLSHRGVAISMGHTNADSFQTHLAILAGARHTTHTYNAMRPLHHREPGVLGVSLGDPGVFCELIYDRIHVHPDAARVLFAAKGVVGVIAVSDATMAAGMAPGSEIEMWGLACTVGEKQVRLHDGTLAGSGITLLDAFQNLLSDFGPEEAIRATSLNPRRSMGLPEPNLYSVFGPSGELKDQIRRPA
jgi:N-acetylglucosamine-6-phosphate deacetylase